MRRDPACIYRLSFSSAPPPRAPRVPFPRSPHPVVLALGLAGMLVRCSGEETPPPPTATCTSDAECLAGERCVPSGICQVGVECLEEAECLEIDPRRTCDLSSFQCTFREGFGDECGPGRPCAFGEFCSTLLGRCLDAGRYRDCARRSQCPANQICDRQANKCISDPGCYSEAFCEPGEICDLVNRACRAETSQCASCALAPCAGDLVCFADTEECLAVEADPVCRLGETCDPLGRCVQCTSSDDCGPGTFCNISVGQCESNIQCADDPSECPSVAQVQCIVCEKPQVCDRRTRRCAAPPEPCESDLDCPNDQLCDGALDPPICVPRLPDCLNDFLDEPRNDSPVAARTLLAEDGPTFEGLRLCPGDQDWYRIEVEAGTFLTVDARFRHIEGDLELQLYLEDGMTLVDQSRSVTDNERVELEVGTDLTFFVRAFLGTQTVRPLDYALRVGREPADLCPDDVAEPNDGPGEARQILFDAPFEGRLCPGDPDWFSLRMVPAGARIILDLDFVDNLGNLDLEIYRAGSPQPLRSSRGASDGEQIELDAPFGGDFFVRVLGNAGDGNVYTLRASLLENAGGACLDDLLEPNDDPLSFTPAEPLLASPEVLSLCSGDEDWFEVELAAFDILEAEIEFDGRQDLDLALLAPGTTDRNESPLRLSDGTDPREHIAFRARTAGRYLLRAYGSRPSDAAEYTLYLRRYRPALCVPDANDALGIGNGLNDTVFLGLAPVRESEATLCAGDEDWYELFVRGGFSNIIRLQYPGDLATLDLQLFDFSGNLLFDTEGQPIQSLRAVDVTLPGNGLAFLIIRVRSTDGNEAPYSLSVDLIPRFTCNDDPAEPNEDAAQASTLTSSVAAPIALTDLSLCASTRSPANVGDEDWFALTPPAPGARIEAEVTFPQGDLLLELLSPSGIHRACVNQGMDRCYSDGSGLSERVTFTATTTRPYFLRVGSVYSAPSVPIRPPEADTPYRLDIRYR